MNRIKNYRKFYPIHTQNIETNLSQNILKKKKTNNKNFINLFKKKEQLKRVDIYRRKAFFLVGFFGIQK